MGGRLRLHNEKKTKEAAVTEAESPVSSNMNLSYFCIKGIFY